MMEGQFGAEIRMKDEPQEPTISDDPSILLLKPVETETDHAHTEGTIATSSGPRISYDTSADKMLNRAFKSPVGLVNIVGYSPSPGHHSDVLTVNLNLMYPVGASVLGRIVVGGRAVATEVIDRGSSSTGRWQLRAAFAAFDSSLTRMNGMPLAVQIVEEGDRILDTVTFGRIRFATTEFEPQYRQAQSPVSSDGSPLLPHTRPLPPSPPRHRAGRARRDSVSNRRHHRAQDVPRMRRTISGSPASWESETSDSSGGVQLVLETLTAPLAHNWTEEEKIIGRRLIRFTREVRGTELHVSCHIVAADDLSEEDIVVSCIYPPNDAAGHVSVFPGKCWITSVEIITLLEGLTDNDFKVEEKNRIRRNLEVLKPISVYKHIKSMEPFFHRIMGFPDPKPRNIEKSLKVYPWDVLPKALEKIISRYSFVSGTQDGDVRIEPSQSALQSSPRSSFSGDRSPLEAGGSNKALSENSDSVDAGESSRHRNRDITNVIDRFDYSSRLEEPIRGDDPGMKKLKAPPTQERSFEGLLHVDEWRMGTHEPLGLISLTPDSSPYMHTQQIPSEPSTSP